MGDLGKVIAHIPARGKSKRVRSKNLRYLGDRPLLAYAVQAALACESLDSVYVNTDSDLIAALAEELGAFVYRRKTSLATDSAKSDEFNMDIIEALNPDTLVMINPVCPFIESIDIEKAIKFYQCDSVDTLITTNSTQMQCFYRDKPININVNEPLAPTQENEPVHVCNWAIAIWDAHKFSERFYRQGFAVFGENRKLFPIDPIKGLKISTEEDFRMAELLVVVMKNKGIKSREINYWTK